MTAENIKGLWIKQSWFWPNLLYSEANEADISLKEQTEKNFLPAICDNKENRSADKEN